MPVTSFNFSAERFPFVEALKDAKKGAVRVVFGGGAPNTVVVVKYSDPEQKESSTVKWFIGSYEAVKSYWNTTVRLSPGEAAAIEPDARRVVERAIDSLTRAASSAPAPEQTQQESA